MPLGARVVITIYQNINHLIYVTDICMYRPIPFFPSIPIGMSMRAWSLGDMSVPLAGMSIRIWHYTSVWTTLTCMSMDVHMTLWHSWVQNYSTPGIAVVLEKYTSMHLMPRHSLNTTQHTTAGVLESPVTPKLQLWNRWHSILLQNFLATGVHDAIYALQVSSACLNRRNSSRRSTNLPHAALFNIGPCTT